MLNKLSATTKETPTTNIEHSSNYSQAIDAIGTLSNNLNMSFRLLYKGFIPIFELENGFRIEDSFTIFALERLENYPMLVDVCNASFSEIKILKDIARNLLIEIDFRKAKELLLQSELDVTIKYWKNQVKHERLKWGGIGAGAGAGVVLLVVLLIVLL